MAETRNTCCWACATGVRLTVSTVRNAAIKAGMRDRKEGFMDFSLCVNNGEGNEKE
jgi:hypothetical protein